MCNAPKDLYIYIDCTRRKVIRPLIDSTCDEAKDLLSKFVLVKLSLFGLVTKNIKGRNCLKGHCVFCTAMTFDENTFVYILPTRRRGEIYAVREWMRAIRCGRSCRRPGNAFSEMLSLLVLAGVLTLRASPAFRALKEFTERKCYACFNFLYNKTKNYLRTLIK